MKIQLKLNRPKLFVFILMVANISSCANLNDERVNLNDEYVYMNLGGNMRTILSREVQFHNHIYPVVTDYAFDENFILAEQKPDEKEISEALAKDFSDRQRLYEMYVKDSAIFNDSFYKRYKGKIESDRAYSVMQDSLNRRILLNKVNYWIIQHSKDSMYGPLTKEEYFIKKKELMIPNNLKLDIEPQ